MALKYESESETVKDSILGTYGREEISFVRGKGASVWDGDGREYVDMVAGIAVNCLGHNHPRLVAAICNQASSIMHTSNLYQIENQSRLASRLASHLPGSGWKTFFSNSGAEANEAALKFAIKSTGRRKILSANNSFHGRTALTLSVTGQPKYWKGFEHLLYRDVSFADYGSPDSFQKLLDDDVACVILEPVQGEGGVIIPPEGFLSEVGKMAKENGSLLIMDEVQTGVGRTGRFFAHSWEAGVKPDIVTMAKALGGGVPIGATIFSSEVAACVTAGDHGSTFGGNPLSTAAANAVLDIIDSPGFLDGAGSRGAMLLDGLKQVFAGAPYVADVRGRGMMIGVEMDEKSAQAFKSFAFERGFLVNIAHGKVVRLVPPLVLGEPEISAFLGMASSFAASRMQ